MSLEDKLLLYLSCTSLNDRFHNKIKSILYENIDWRYVVRKAIHNRVIPMLHQNLITLKAKESRELIPKDVIEKIRELNYSFIGHSLALHEGAKKIFRSLKAGDIEFTPIKGILLAETIYPQKLLRFFADIDLFFPNIYEMKKAEKKLVKLKYNYLRSNPKECVFCKHRHGISIECDMHRLFGLFRFFEYPPQIGELWNRSSNKKVEGVNVKVMSAEHILLFLCLNSVFNRSFSLTDLCDAFYTLKRAPSLDWHFISSQVKEYSCAACIFFETVNILGADLFNRKFIPQKFFKSILDDNGIMPKISWEPSNQFLENLQYPATYKNFCLKCDNKTNCELFLYFKNSPSFSQKNHLHFLRNLLFEYYWILTRVRERYGLKYALRCFYQESIGILNILFREFKINKIGYLLLSSIEYWEMRK